MVGGGWVTDWNDGDLERYGMLQSIGSGDDGRATIPGRRVTRGGKLSPVVTFRRSGMTYPGTGFDPTVDAQAALVLCSSLNPPGLVRLTRSLQYGRALKEEKIRNPHLHLRWALRFL